MALGRGLGSLIPPKTTQAKPKSTVDSSVPKTGMFHVSPKDIDVNPEQPRKVFTKEAITDLTASIKEHGILQPLLVTEKDDGTYELIAGERRLRCSMDLGLTTVPVVLRTGNPDQQEKLELALIENIQRDDLNVIEEACAYERFVTEFGLTHDEIAQRVGKSRTAVSNTMRLLQLPDEIQKALIDSQISMGKARALLGMKDKDEQMRMFRSMMGGGVTVRDVEREVARKRIPAKGNRRRDPNIVDMEGKLREKLGTKVRVTKTGNRGKIEIEYYSDEEFNELSNLLLS